MTAGVRGGGFVMGAVGGLALALLLIGAVSYLPHANTASQALYSPEKDAGQGASAASATTYAAATTTSAGAAYVPASQTTSTIAGPQAAGGNSPRNSSQSLMPSSSTTAASPPAVNTATVTATTTIATTTVTVAGGAFVYGPGASTPTTTANVSNALAGVSGGQQPQQRPNSLLAVLPGESVGNLVATLSPLLVGLLVAVLIYSAYSRRQDSSS
jgi:hypothetical protein